MALKGIKRGTRDVSGIAFATTAWVCTIFTYHNIRIGETIGMNLKTLKQTFTVFTTKKRNGAVAHAQIQTYLQYV